MDGTVTAKLTAAAGGAVAQVHVVMVTDGK